LNIRSAHVLKAIFLIAAKLTKCRENRQPGPIKSKSIVFLLQTAFFHIKNQTSIASTKKCRMLPRETTNETAQLHFIEHMTGETILDKFKCEIKIRDSDIECFYKDIESFRHIVAPENFIVHRARRLPWVIPTLSSTHEIYQLDKPKYKCTDYFYVAKFLIPYEATALR